MENVSWGNVANADVGKPKWYTDAIQPQSLNKYADVAVSKLPQTTSCKSGHNLRRHEFLFGSKNNFSEEMLKITSNTSMTLNPYLKPSLAEKDVKKFSWKLSKSTPALKKHDEIHFGEEVVHQQWMDKVTESFEQNKNVIEEDTFCQSLPLNANWDFPDSLKIQTSQSQLSSSEHIKILLINCVSATLISSPKFTNMKEKRCNQIYSLVEQIVSHDPEFILKLALYARQELNIRSTSNFLLACAAHFLKCRSHLEKYFCAAVQLPSDWIDVAEKYKICFNNGKVSLPSALRKCLVKKFPDFDEYQLAKYNKGKKVKKTKNAQETQSDKEKTEYSDENHKPFTLKSLIRLLHITRPAYNVMCILGKKYPETMQMFYDNGLDGTWNNELAGNRMKLKIPITWETQVSLKGNTPQVWQDLIDSKALPYMATLRNIRNMIRAGISKKHHDIVLKYLSNRNAVARSRQFPFRFLSAYEVLEDLSEDLEKQKLFQEKGWAACLPKPLFDIFTQNGKNIFNLKEPQKGKITSIKRAVNKKYSKGLMYNEETVGQYKKAVGMALDIATSDNLIPIRGRTLIACDVSQAMRVPCNIVQNGSKRKLHEIAILLGLMCYSASEHSTLLVYGCGKIVPVEIEKGGILSNVTSLLNMCHFLDVDNPPDKCMWKKYLNAFFTERTQLDQFIILSNQIPVEDEKSIHDFLSRYRTNMNKHTMFYNIEISGKGAAFGKDMHGNANNIKVCGFSDQLLRYIANGGGEKQLFQVQNIDRTRQLHSKNSEEPRLPVMLAKALSIPVRTRETINVFISSTLKDMTGERSALAKFVFPELRRRAYKLNMDIVECDFTWGIPNVTKKSLVNLCLNEISKCHFFVGIVGDRYGWVPKKQDLPEGNIRKHLNKSITELEIDQGLCCHSEKKEKRVFLYLRKETSTKRISKSCKRFLEESVFKQQELLALRKRVEKEGGRKYNAEWDLSKQGKPVTTSLTEFSEMVLSDLWKAINLHSEEHKIKTTHENYTTQLSLANQSAVSFVGRQQFLKRINEKLHAATQSFCNPLNVLVGKEGCGKTSIMAKIAHDMEGFKNRYMVIKHFVGFTPTSDHTTKAIIDSLCYQLQDHLLHNDAKTQGLSFKDGVDLLLYMVKSVKYHQGVHVVVVLDGLDLLIASSAETSLQWIQALVASEIVVVLSCIDKGWLHCLLKLQQNAAFHIISTIHGRDSAAIIRKQLSVYSKSLNEETFDNQLQKLLLKPESKFPIYLEMACEYLRLFGEFATLNLQIKKLPGDVQTLLQHWITTIELFVKSSIAVEAILCIIYCMPCGVESETLYSIIHWLASFHEEGRMERSQFCQIVHLLGIFFCQPKTSSKIFFSNKIFSNAVCTRYFSAGRGNMLRLFYHKAIALYHLLSLNDNTKSVSSTVTSLFWLPYHVHASGNKKFLLDLLTSVKFIKSKCYYGCSKSLLDNLKLTMESKNNGFDFDQLYSCIQSYQTTMEQYPIITNQCLADFGFEVPVEHVAPVLCVHTYKEKSNCCTATLSEMVDSHPSCIAISPSGSKVACGSKAGNLAIYSALGEERLQVIQDCSSTVALVYVSNALLLCGKVDGKITLWNDEGGLCISEINAHKKCVVAICLSACGSYILSIGLDKVLNIWKVSNLDENFALESPPYAKHVIQSIPNCIDMHPKQPKCALGLWNATIQIWDYVAGKKLAVFRGCCSSVVSVKFSACGKYLYSAALNSSGIQVWASCSGHLITEIDINMDIKSLCVVPECDYVVVSGNKTGNMNDGSIEVWSGNLGKKIGCLLPNQGNVSHALCCSISSCHTKVAVGYWDQKLIVTDIEAKTASEFFNLHEGPIRCVCWMVEIQDSKEKEFIVTCSDDKLVKLTLASSLKLFLTLRGHTGSVLSVACCERYIASASEDFSIILWSRKQIFCCESQSMQPTYYLRSTSVPTCLSFNGSGTTLVSGKKDRSLSYWQVPHTYTTSYGHDLKVDLTVNNAHRDWMTACCWCTSNDRVVTGSNDCLVKIWLKDSLLMTMQSHEGFITSVCWQGDYILSTDNLGLLVMWSSSGIEITSSKTSCQINDSSMVCRQLIETSLEKEEVMMEDWYAQTEYESWKKVHKEKISAQSTKRLVTQKNQHVVVAMAMDNGVIETLCPLGATPITTMTGYSEPVMKIVSHKSTLYSCTSDTIKIWQLEKPDQYASNSSGKLRLSHDTPVSCMAVQRNFLFAGCTDGVLKVFNMHTVSHLSEILQEKLHKKEVSGIEIDLLLSDKTNDFVFCTCGFDGFIKICSMSPSKHCICILSSIDLKNAITMITTETSTFGRNLCIGNVDGMLLKVTLDPEYKLVNKTTLNSCEEGWYRFAIHLKKDSKTVCLNDKGHFFNHEGHFDLGVETYVTTVSKSQPVAVGDSKGHIYFLKNNFKKKIHNGKITHISNFGDLLITASLDQMIKVWITKTMKQVGFYKAPSGIAHASTGNEDTVIYIDVSGMIYVLRILVMKNIV